MNKKSILILIGMGSVAVSTALAGDCIIDPQKVMVHASSEPIFMSADEKARDVASQPASGESHYSRGHDQYLDVLKVIPFSEPAVHRAWLEYKIMKED